VRGRGCIDVLCLVAKADVSDFERARRPEQKLIRRKAIVDAAVALFDAGGLDGTSLSAVAREAGLSKANLYRYFDSREAILLQVLSDEQAAWLDRITTDLQAIAGKDDIDAVANVLADSLADRPRLLALMAAMSSVLEHNVGIDTILELKRGVLADSFKLVSAFAAALPSLPFDALADFVKHYYLFAAALWPAARPSAAVAEVLARPEFSAMCVEIRPSLRDHARLLLRGLRAG